MAAAGEYRDRFDWGKRTRGTPTAFGERVDAYPSLGFVWGALDDRSATRSTEKESERQVSTATIRLRSVVGIVAGDRLTDGDGRVWEVKEVTPDRRANETRCECEARP